MDTKRIGVLKTLSVRNAVKQENTSKIDVATNYTVNCGEKHSADSKECRIWRKEKEILRIKFTRNISFVEARKLVEAPIPISGISNANITQSSMKKVSVVDTATQTDPITILDSAVQSNTTNTNSKTEDLQKQKVKQTPQTKIKQRHLLRRNKRRGWPEKSHHGDKKRLEQTTTERKTSKKSIIYTYERTNKIKI